MNEALCFLIGIGVGAGLATVMYMRRILASDSIASTINTPARSVSVDDLIFSALGHEPLRRGSTIHDIPHQGGRHRADDDEPLPEPIPLHPDGPQWPSNNSTHADQ